jgi:hypothetical protein
MGKRFREIDGLEDPGIPKGYNQPGFGVGTADLAGPGEDQLLLAQSAAATPNGIDPLNKGFQIGGADDPLSEFEANVNNPTGYSVGGKPSAPLHYPSYPAMSSMNEGEYGAPVGLGEDDDSFIEDDGAFDETDDLFSEEENPFAENDDVFDEDESPFDEDDAMFAEEDMQIFDDIDAVPAFEDIAEDPALAALPVDANGVIEPERVDDEEIFDPDLGAIPDATLPLEEPIVEIDEDDVDIEIPENVFENDGVPEPIIVEESFKLPENQSIVISKGDHIFLLGHVREEFTPKFAESVFTRALKSLAESKGRGRITMIGRKREKVGIVGRSILVEVAKDWRLPGAGTIFEAHDLLQIVSAKPVREADETEDDPKSEGKRKKEDDDDGIEEDAEEEKLKKEALSAYRRWKEAAKRRKESGEDDEIDEDEEIDEDDEDGVKEKSKKERRKREAELLKRQRTGGWI